MHIYDFFFSYPSLDGPYLFTNNENDLLTRPLILLILKHTFSFGLLLPNALCSLKQYYPLFNIPFDHIEFVYLDFWVGVLPVMEELLIYLVQTFEPLNEPLQTEFFVIPSTVGIDLLVKKSVISPDRSSPCIMIKPLIKEKEELKLEDHLKEYYFNNNVTSKDFLAIIELYLQERPALKESCLKLGNEEKALGKNIPENLGIYFISNFLTKDLTSYMHRFIIANLNLNDKNPLYTLRDLLIKKGDTYPKKIQDNYLKKGRLELKKQIESLDTSSLPSDVVDVINKALSKMS